MNNVIMSKCTTLNHQYVQRTAVLQNVFFDDFATNLTFGKWPLGKLSHGKSPLGKCLWEST